MFIFSDDSGNINSVFILLLFIPIFLMLIFSFYESSLLFNNSVSDISSDKLSVKTSDFIGHIDIAAKESLSNLSFVACRDKIVFSNASFEIRKLMMNSLNNLAYDYYNEGIVIGYDIVDIVPSDDPFCVDVYYRVNSSLVNSSKFMSVSDVVSVSIVDSDYPVYDSYIAYRKDLVNLSVYSSIGDFNIISKSPIVDYSSYGHNRSLLANCISNGHYHFSHDGLCILCRFENRSVCHHNGIERFIVQDRYLNESVVSVDHVLFNVSGGVSNQYNGSVVFVNESVFLYLDEGHRSKYGL